MRGEWPENAIAAPGRTAKDLFLRLADESGSIIRVIGRFVKGIRQIF